MRDLRLDFFRGIALFLIFIDHIPGNVLSHFTTQSIGFSDAAEIFIFISGYTAALVYGHRMLERGTFIATVKTLHRVPIGEATMSSAYPKFATAGGTGQLTVGNRDAATDLDGAQIAPDGTRVIVCS